MAKAEFFNEISNFYGSLSKGKRLSLWLGIGLLFALLVVLAFSYSQKETMGVLFSNLDSKDASEVVKYLKEKNVEYRLSKGGSTILVPKEDVYNLRLELASEGLPKGGGVGFEIFDKTNIGMTDFLERIEYIRALQGELARTISKLDAVQFARVHLVIPKKSLFLEERKEPTASVLLKLKEGVSLTKGQVKGIVHLVSSAVEGLKPENVTVVDTNGRVLSDILASEKEEEENKIGGLNRIEYKRKLERLYEQKILSLLGQTLGRNKVVAKVSVDVDFGKVEQYKEFYDPENVVRSEEITSEKGVGNLPKVGGIPGVESNLGPPEVLSKEGSKVRYSKEHKIRNYEVSKTTEKRVEPAGVIKRISAAVMVDGTYEVKKEGKKEKRVYHPRSKEEIEAIKKVVMGAIGYNPKRKDSVEVVNVPFNTEEQELLQKSFAKEERKVLILSILKYLVYFVFVVMLILFVLRPLVKWIVEGGLTREPTPKEEVGVDLTVGEEEEGAAPETYAMRAPPEVDPNEVLEDIVGKEKMEELQLDKVKMKVLMEQIRNWVRENPTSTAQLLEVWLEEGSTGGE